MERDRLDSIQMFRCFAALAVFFFHLDDVLPFGPQSFLGHFIYHGNSGVDMFFVISGFIAFYTVNRDENKHSYYTHPGMIYLLKRIAKIIPLYYTFTLLCAGHSLESFYQTLKSFLFIPLGLGQGGPLYGEARVSQGWTLNYEMYFYLVVAASFIFGKLKWYFVYSFIILMILFPIILHGIPNNYGFNGFLFSIAYLSMISNPIVLEFLLGITVGIIYSKSNDKINLIWMIFIISSFSFFILNLYEKFNNYSRFTVSGIPSALLIISFLKLEKSRQINIHNILVKLGNMSFSIYIAHLGIIVLIRKIISRTINQGHHGFSLWLGLGIFALSSILTYYVSSLTYNYLELKLSIKFRKWLLSRKIFNDHQIEVNQGVQ
ncbi:acyltransferase family protein [Sodalis ligni]|uniref:Peptidoglycan/LPS O-acetylase OafA/YrhL n=1 Tax=Sodalis ligni TaxID=2697027 RepID=A0A4V2Q2Q5_9GAMM|nr:acyltransferase [Sodalis ligni]TCL03748.1 peptidoglycan/LPS O-acetylase OafA/YrhL [Sodalis ligni]